MLFLSVHIVLMVRLQMLPLDPLLELAPHSLGNSSNQKTFSTYKKRHD